jgi:DNA invertase Pin-like site-specific DNA recombinase
MHLQRLGSYGVGFHSYTEPHLATDNELVHNILLVLLASLGKLEAQKLSDRTKPAWRERELRGAASGGRRSMLSFVRKSLNGQPMAKRLTASPRRSTLIGIPPPSTRLIEAATSSFGGNPSPFNLAAQAAVAPLCV